MRGPRDWPFPGRGEEGPRWRERRGVREPRPPHGCEPWEVEAEPFEGATVLDDLVLVVGDTPGAAGVLARYAVLRLVLRAASGASSGPIFLAEQNGAIEYLRAPGAAGPAERRALGLALRLAGRRPPRAIAAALLDAGAEAARREHPAGAFALYRAAYQLAVERDWAAEAARAAAALAAHAESRGGRRSAGRWRRRAARLARRARDDAGS